VDLIKGQCKERSNFLRTVQAFSLIDVILVFVAVSLLVYEWFAVTGNRSIWLFCTVAFAVCVLCNVITWATYAGYFRRTSFCVDGTPSWQQEGWKLDWAFGVRIIEIPFLILLTVLSILNLSGGKGRTMLNRVALLTGVFLLLLTIITTSSRGWMRQTGAPSKQMLEQGPWDGCVCTQNYFNQCDVARSRMRGAEVFSVLSIVGAFALIALLLDEAPTFKALNIQRVVCGLNFVFILITIALFTENVNAIMCGQDAATDSQRLHWAYGIECAGFILQAILFLILMALPVEARKEAASEPVPSS
jgi:hypothetical protein